MEKREDYRKAWEGLCPIIATMTTKNGLCHHELGQSYYFRNPYEKPEGICMALWHVLELYSWRVALGFPSWEPDDETVYRLHCPCETGTVWEMRKADPADYEQWQTRRENSGEAGDT